MTRIRTASAIILISALLAFSLGCSKEDEDDSIDFGDATKQTIANEVTFSEPAIGGNAVLSQDTLDDLTACLIIRNISQLPDDSEEGNYYSGKLITIELTDNKSGVTVKSVLPKNPYVYSTEDSGKMRIDADCAADSVELLSIEDNGKKAYLLKVEYAREGDRRIVSFASCDISGQENSKGGLKWYETDSSNQADYECKVSSKFEYKGGNRFSDSLTELEYEFDTKNLRITVDNF